MKSAVTISLVPEAARGPFVFHCGAPQGLAGMPLAEAFERAAGLGFDAVEIFAADAPSFPRVEVTDLLGQHSLALAAIGTGAGWLRHGLSLSAVAADARLRAVEFAGGIVDLAADFACPAIIGSMQGRSEGVGDLDEARGRLADSLRPLSQAAANRGQVLLYEPLNRYETDLFNRQAEAAAFLDAEGLAAVRLLCDLFHMSIEEPDIAATLIAVGPRVGHVHWADSNRRAIGMGHTQVAPVIAALAEIGFGGYLSAEVLPLPTAEAAAAATIASVPVHAG